MENLKHSSAAKADEKDTPRVYTKQMQLLAPMMLALGVFFERLVLSGESGVFFPVFFLLCAVAVVVLNFPRFQKNRPAQAAFAAALLVGALHAFHPNADQTSLGACDLLVLPGLSMLSAVLTVRSYPKKREGALALDYVKAWTVGAVAAVPRFFGAAGALAGGSKRGAWKTVLIGLAVAIPTVAAVLALLCSADTAMAALVAGLFGGLNLSDLFWRVVVALVTAMLVYSAVYTLTYGPEKTLPEYRPGSLPAVTFSIAVAALIVIYAVFAFLQFQYLFGGSLPQQYTYSEYARQGFMELVVVSFINLTLFGLTLRYTMAQKGAHILLGVLLAATAVLLLSAGARLLLYIGAYGLTFNRILPLWLMLYLAYVLVLAAVRLKKESMPLLYAAAWSLVVWYLMLYLPDWQRIIFSYNAL